MLLCIVPNFSSFDALMLYLKSTVYSVARQPERAFPEPTPVCAVAARHSEDHSLEAVVRELQIMSEDPDSPAKQQDAPEEAIRIRTRLAAGSRGNDLDAHSWASSPPTAPHLLPGDQF